MRVVICIVMVLVSAPQRAITQNLDSLIAHALTFAAQQAQRSVDEIRAMFTPGRIVEDNCRS